MGIAIGSNFDMQAALHLDSRSIKEDTTARDAILGGIRYEGMIVYCLTPGLFYVLRGGITNSDWMELGEATGISPGGGGGNLVWNDGSSPAPVQSLVDGFRLRDFEQGGGQSLYAFFTVPDTYEPTTPIILQGMKFFGVPGTGDVELLVETTLLEAGATILGTYTHTHTSTQSGVSLVTPNQLEDIGDIDLTDEFGEIDSQLLIPGDVLRLRLYRSASDTAAGLARVVEDSGVIKATE